MMGLKPYSYSWGRYEGTLKILGESSGALVIRCLKVSAMSDETTLSPRQISVKCAFRSIDVCIAKLVWRCRNRNEMCVPEETCLQKQAMVICKDRAW